MLRAFLFLFYFVRFAYYSIKEKSLCFLRYYPGYHGSTIPSLNYITNTSNKIFQNDVDIPDGVDMNENKQLLLLTEFCRSYNDYNPPRKELNDRLYFYENRMFGFNDGFALYCFLKKFQPKRIVEIGSGYSSALMLDVCRELAMDTTLTFIDPWSTKILDVLKSNPDLDINYVREEVQNVDLSLFKELAKDDILFIDTSHVVKIGSDLSHIFFKIIPLLSSGVIVHIHDIWYPFEYPKAMIFEGCGYNETYFVRSFLQFNTSFEILFFGSFLESRHKQKFEQIPGYFKDSGKSLWLRKVA